MPAPAMPAPAAEPPLFCTAPMMRRSHRHALKLWRLLCPPATLYTEMIPAAALAHRGGRHDPGLNPVALQVAGSDPAQLAKAAGAAQQLGYCEINLNCGCPSKKVTAGGFGACLMADPELVGKLVAALRGACALPVTVKCRTALDELDPPQCLLPLAQAVADAGGAGLIVHARRALLAGLNPKQNRTRPPLEPHWAQLVKRRLPSLRVISNGGIGSLREARQRCAGVDGVMLGRAVVARPALLAEFRTAWYGLAPQSLGATVRAYLGYCAAQLRAGEHPRRLLAPLAGLAAGRPGARSFRRDLHGALTSGDLAGLRTHWQ